MKAETLESISPGLRADSHYHYSDGEWRSLPVTLPEEASLPIFVNGQEIVSILCTPERLNCLVLGFLTSQGLISSPSDMLSMRVCTEELLADVRLKGPATIPARRSLTSGCGGGVSLDEGWGLAPLSSQRTYPPIEVLLAVQMLLQYSNHGRAEGKVSGMHASALSNGQQLLATSRDIGRHNTLDKIWGECLLRKISTVDNILVTTGRISSDMVTKAIRMRVPLVASVNSATERAVELGRKFGVAVVGYARSSQFTVFCGRERIARGSEM